MKETITKIVKDPITGKDVKITAVYEDGWLVSQTNEISFDLLAMPLCAKCHSYHLPGSPCINLTLTPPEK